MKMCPHAGTLHSFGSARSRRVCSSALRTYGRIQGISMGWPGLASILLWCILATLSVSTIPGAAATTRAGWSHAWDVSREIHKKQRLTGLHSRRPGLNGQAVRFAQSYVKTLEASRQNPRRDPWKPPSKEKCSKDKTGKVVCQPTKRGSLPVTNRYSG